MIDLAIKAGKYDYCMGKLKRGEKITYYGGGWELYNPFPIIERWQIRLDKLMETQIKD